MVGASTHPTKQHGSLWPTLISKPTHKEIKQYYEELGGYASHEVSHEGATSTAFQNLLAATCKKADWHLVPQLPVKAQGKSVRPDGTLRDEFNLHHGYWEAKDTSNKLDVDIRKKIAQGYPPFVDYRPDVTYHSWHFKAATDSF
jgi:hypothetical protein